MCEEDGGQKGMHGVGNMDTEGNSQEGKLEIWKEKGLGSGLTRVEKVMVLDRVDLRWL